MTQPPTRLTPARLAEIEARTTAATPGPWEPGNVGQGDSFLMVYCADTTGQRIADCTNDLTLHTTREKRANAAFIAHARTDIPALLADRRALEAENARLREALVALADAADLLHDKLHIVQPFLAIYKEHGGVISDAQARRSVLQSEPKEPQ